MVGFGVVVSRPVSSANIAASGAEVDVEVRFGQRLFWRSSLLFFFSFPLKSFGDTRSSELEGKVVAKRVFSLA